MNKYFKPEIQKKYPKYYYTNEELKDMKATNKLADYHRYTKELNNEKCELCEIDKTYQIGLFDNGVVSGREYYYGCEKHWLIIIQDLNEYLDNL